MKRRRNRRVLMVVENNYYPGDKRVRTEAIALAGAGYDVSVISPASRGAQLREVLDGVRVYRYPAPEWGEGFLGYLREYTYSLVKSFLLSIEVLRRDGFDVIHAANPPDTFALMAAVYKLLGKKFVFDHHDLSPEMYEARFGSASKRLVYRALLLLENFSCHLADHVIETNESYRTVDMERNGVPADRTTIVRNGPDLELYQGAEPFPELRDGGKTVILFGGGMNPQDGLDYLMRALKHLRYDLGRTDFRCVLVGGREVERQRLARLSSQLAIDDYVHFTGWVTDADWARYMVSADICVDPDPKNPFNDRSTMVKMMQYMAAGRPIVAFDLTEHRFTAQDAALYVKPNDEMEFARALALLMDDPAKRETMGAFGRRRAETELAWSHSVPKLLSAYRKLFGGQVSEVMPPPMPQREEVDVTEGIR